ARHARPLHAGPNRGAAPGLLREPLRHHRGGARPHGAAVRLVEVDAEMRSREPAQQAGRGAGLRREDGGPCSPGLSRQTIQLGPMPRHTLLSSRVPWVSLGIARTCALFLGG
ncbi:unnamed protein product, partial [Prorocentrum cordatum]